MIDDHTRYRLIIAHPLNILGLLMFLGYDHLSYLNAFTRLACYRNISPGTLFSVEARSVIRQSTIHNA